MALFEDEKKKFANFKFNQKEDDDKSGEEGDEDQEDDSEDLTFFELEIKKNEEQMKKINNETTSCHSSLFEEEIPDCLHWTRTQVADWIATLGFPQYKSCFIKNFVTGRKLIYIHASTLPKIGITDFEHIKFISKKIREKLKVPFISGTHSVADPYTNDMGVYLELRSKKTIRRTQPSYEEVKSKFNCLILQPPLHLQIW